MIPCCMLCLCVRVTARPIQETWHFRLILEVKNYSFKVTINTLADLYLQMEPQFFKLKLKFFGGGKRKKSKDIDYWGNI